MASENEPKYTYEGIAAFRAVCYSCGLKFGYPMLGEMLSYGEFVATSERGDLYAYVSAFTGEWDDVERIIEMISPKWRAADPGYRRFHWIIGQCLDPLEGQALSIVSGPICPGCQSRDIAYGDAERLGFQRVPDATWRRFMSLSPAGRRQFVEKLWTESEEPAKRFAAEEKERLDKAWNRHLKNFGKSK